MERRKRALGRYKMKEVVRGDSIVIVSLIKLTIF